MHRILFVLGTRPEAIKLCPLLLHLRGFREQFEVRLCVTAQHREMLDQALAAFGVAPHYDLDSMIPGQSLLQSSARILAGLEPVLKSFQPSMVVVQGDTTSTLCGALSAFYAGITIAHVEAGLRTGDPRQPFPEEMNRVLATRLAQLHFAATQTAAENLRAEGVPEAAIHVTGNTGIDAVLHVRDSLAAHRLPGGNWPWLDPRRRLLLLTAHRRENFGEALRRICSAMAILASDPSVQIAWPVHPNPEVQRHAEALAVNSPGVHLLPPLEYVPFVDLMRRAHFLLTDSGGVQEEAPSLGKPVLVLRDKTERTEAVAAGAVKLVGSDPSRIIREARRLLDSPAAYQGMIPVHNPYGDGRASCRIERVIRSFFGSKFAQTAA